MLQMRVLELEQMLASALRLVEGCEKRKERDSLRIEKLEQMLGVGGQQLGVGANAEEMD